MKLEAVRTYEEVGVLIEDAISLELAQARAGERASVSSKAAARYLGKHVKTLQEWRRKSPPEGPAFEKGPMGGGSGNEHVHYPWEALVDWKSSRHGLTPRKRRVLDELDSLKQRERELELEEELRALRRRVSTLEANARKRKTLGFASITDLAEEHDWVMADGLVLGHVLTVSDEDLARAIAGSVDNILSMPVTEALGLPWASYEGREPVEEVVQAALAGISGAMTRGAEDGERMRAQQLLRELEEAVPQATTRAQGNPL